MVSTAKVSRFIMIRAREAQVQTAILCSRAFSCIDAVPTCAGTRGRLSAMSEPLVVVIPHRLGKDEALRRIKDGIGRGRNEFARLLTIEQETWSGDRLTFGVKALGQRATGIIDVSEQAV